MAFDFAPRYFLVIFFLPFIFLGFWFKFLTEKLKLVGIFIVILISLVLISANLWMVEKTFLSGQNPNKIAGKAYPGFSLRNAEMISNYILNKAANYPGRNIYVYASKVRYLFSARYFIDKNAKNIKTLLVPQEEADQSIEPGSILFYIQVNSIMQIKYDTELYRMLDSAHIDSYDILVLEKK
jgi:hypothetical protein